MELTGRRVLVTGASRGIGRALAERFAAAGARVALVARSEGPLKELASRLDGTAHPTDLADPEQVEGLIARVEADGGPIDVLVNNAGIDVTKHLTDQTPDEVAQIVQTNLTAPIQLCRQVVPGMIERRAGHIVNVSSLAGVGGFPGMTTYCATKAGLTQFTAILRADLKGLPVKTTVVELGPIPTDMLDHVNDYEPTHDSFRRFYRLQLLVDVPSEKVADEVVGAVRKGRRHVRLPKRALLFPLLSEAPRRMAEILLTGVKHRP